jgi:hypothetical protein
LKKVVFFTLTTLLLSQEYDRGDWRHWVDADSDGQDTRQEVLIAENIAPDSLTEYDSSGRIIKGLWVCPYTGDSITNPRQLDIDHLVPLKEAHVSGGFMWTDERRELYANDLTTGDNHLVAVTASSNRSKGAKDPYHWMPDINHCWYLENWIDIKYRWTLDMDYDEQAFIEVYIEERCECND